MAHMTRKYAALALAGAALLPLGACGDQPVAASSTATTESAMPSPTHPPDVRYADPIAMRAKIEASGIKLRDCGTPAYDITGSVAMTCMTIAVPSEAVALAVFEAPESGVKAAKLIAADPTRHGQVGYRWFVMANTKATVDKIVASLG